MKSLKSFCFFFLFPLLLWSQYTEDFSFPEKGYLENFIDDFNGVDWTMTAWPNSVPNPNLFLGRDITNYFKTTSAGVLEAIDLDVEVCWVSPELNITSTPASFSLDLSWIGFDQDLDYINVEYTTNGGISWSQVPNQVGGGLKTIQYNGASGPTTTTSTTVGATGLSGSTLQIRVCIDNSSLTEVTTLDNVSATNADVPGNGPVCDLALTGITVGDENCPGGNDGSLVIAATTTNGPITYSISGPVNQSNSSGVFTDLPDGLYTIVVDDDSFILGACSKSATRTIAAGVDTQPPTASNPATTTVACDGDIPAIDPAVVIDEDDNCVVPCTTEPWINEFHYSNTSADVNEFIEIAGPAGLNLSAYTLYTYDGFDGQVDQTFALSGTIDNEQNGFGALSFTLPNPLQNQLEGIALVKNGTIVIEFLSYEGTILAQNGPAQGMSSTDVGVFESDSQATNESLARIGTGNDGIEFTFVDQLATPGSINGNQTMMACPENLPTVAYVSETDNGAVGNAANPRIIVRTYSVTDAAGNQIFVTHTINVIDNEPPVAACQNVTANLDANGDFALTTNFVFTQVVTSRSDNCQLSGTVGVGGSINYDCDDVGDIPITFGIKDVNGNETPCSIILTIADPLMVCNQPPTAVCQNITVQVDGNCQGTATAADFDGGSSDPDLDPITFSVNPAGPYVLGSTNVVLTVSDAQVSSTCNATITVEDNAAPTALCQDVTLQLDAAGNGTTTAAAVDNGSNDACGILSTTLSQTSFACADVGANAVTLTVTDNNGNSATCSATVTVQDNVAPNAICQDLTLQLDAAGNGATTAAAVDNGSNDACGIMTTTLSQTSFACADVGANAVTLTVTDNNGNTATCSATVTVQDNVAPNAICQDLTLQLDAAGNGATTAAAVDNGSNDACGIMNTTLSQTSFSCADVGANGVTLTVTDNNGNSATCSATVTVQDNVAPNAICQDLTLQLDANGNGATTPAAVDNGSNDACGIMTTTLSQTSFACAEVGANGVTLTVTDNNGNTATCSATVTVEDNIAPTALCQNVTVQLDAAGNGATTAAAVDNGSNDACGILSTTLSQTSFACAEVGANGVTLTVTDNNGNTATCSATVTVQDNIAPTALCQNVTVQLDAAGNGATTAAAVDNGSNDACGILSTSLSQTSFACAEVGANGVTLTVTDNNGNTATCSATVTVEDNIAPTALCQNVTVQLDAAGNGATTAAAVDNGSNDACGILSTSLSQTSFACAEVGANGVTLTVTDNNGNTATCSATVTVEDNIAPTALCQNVTVQLDAAGNGATTAAAVDNGSNDACGILSTSLSQTSFGCAEVGANGVTLTVTDNNGNTATCSATVTVEDNIAPTALCQNVTVQLDAAGNGATTAAAVNNGSNDACGILTTSLSQTSFACADVGANAVTLTVTDNNGNSATCSATVTVEDNIAPTVVCKNPTLTFNGETSLSISSTDVFDMNASTDNCGTVFFVSQSQADFSCADVGSVLPVTVIGVDGNGNQNNCTAYVTVTGLPCGFMNLEDGIACPGGSSATYDAPSGTFAVSSEGCSPDNNFQDGAAYVKYEFCGNGEFIVRVTGVIGDGWAGITMRESAAPGAKKVALFSNLGDFIRTEVRFQTNGIATPQNTYKPNSPWLRIKRQGNKFLGYVSVNGNNWVKMFNYNIPMASCIQMGLVVISADGSSNVTATFDNVSIDGNSVQPLSIPLTDQLPVANSLIEAADFSLYPNPATNQVYLDLANYTGQEATVVIYNQLGQEVLQKRIEVIDSTPELISIGNLGNGTYLVRLMTKDGQRIKKLLINNY